jgi:hypothetical protein
LFSKIDEPARPINTSGGKKRNIRVNTRDQGIMKVYGLGIFRICWCFANAICSDMLQWSYLAAYMTVLSLSIDPYHPL